MIEVSLCVDDICHNCPKFEPNYQHIQLKSGSGEIELNSITINCTNSNFCNYIRKYLKKKRRMIMMKNLKCECCGAPLKINLNPYFDNYFCDYCGSKYKADNEGVIRIETYQNPVRTLMAKTYVSDDAVKYIGEENAAEYSIKNLSRNLAESLAPMLTIEKEYDPQYMRHIITAKVRVVEPDYRF